MVLFLHFKYTPMLKLLLTGSTGLIGSQALLHWLQQGISCRILVRNPKHPRILDLQKKYPLLEVYTGDILDIPSLNTAADGVQVVVHAAAVVSFGEVPERVMWDTNVEGTRNVCEVCRLLQISHLLYISSVAAIGRNATEDEITEDTKWSESELNSVYAKTKYLAELEVWRAHQEGLGVSIVCPSVVLGPSDWNKSSTKIFRNLYKGMMFYPTGSVNVVDVRDVVAAADILLQQGPTNQRYIISAGSIVYKSFFEQICNAMGRKAPSTKLTKEQALPLYAVLRWLIPWVLNKMFITRETIIITSSHIRYSNTKFKLQFQFEYRPLSESIAWAAKEVVAHNTAAVKSSS